MWLRAGGAVALTEPALHTTTANWEHLEWHVHAAPRIAPGSTRTRAMGTARRG